jgi:uncharacterized protein YcnI
MHDEHLFVQMSLLICLKRLASMLAALASAEVSAAKAKREVEAKAAAKAAAKTKREADAKASHVLVVFVRPSLPSANPTPIRFHTLFSCARFSSVSPRHTTLSRL